jgi:hypothetical protein
MAPDGMTFIPNFIKIGQEVFYLTKEDGRMDRRTDVACSDVITTQGDTLFLRQCVSEQCSDKCFDATDSA